MTSPQRELVAARAGGCCEYCRCAERFSPTPFSIEHVVPRARGGSDQTDDLAFACQGCNNFKYVSTEALDPVTGQSVPLYNPRTDQWAEHFAWSEDFTIVVGLTPVGRATVVKLQLNRAGVVNLRRILHGVRLHPPQEPPAEG